MICGRFYLIWWARAAPVDSRQSNHRHCECLACDGLRMSRVARSLGLLSTHAFPRRYFLTAVTVAASAIEVVGSLVAGDMACRTFFINGVGLRRSGQANLWVENAQTSF
jgi:hypothetical protein